ncbi:hypothetical protein PGTUg99_036765 [Puccinia graminis f. sp. tritici]|uniref:Uncharacterized protein n=1 Tax=Puccinia graminis f. sp. tritici TaxID=56615 RepID=A0A5B0SFY4_PUCGR|nr:hypothetical protein PGTUg99_036765 [Puccinia graminis f. sp. tritici]
MWIFGLYSLILLVGSINCGFLKPTDNPCGSSSRASIAFQKFCCDPHGNLLLEKPGCKPRHPPSVKRMA